MYIIIYNLQNYIKHDVVHDVKHFSIATEDTGKYFRGVFVSHVKLMLSSIQKPTMTH